ncbi:glycerol-3-phosphate 1-O-acyltransferase PlsY [Gloeobacter violaceus]|uniref:Glycerol-3-phosphate acyltransferase n=1 Tax=Gloeobacter violaceus (strain ATCC 29082 / PCC 7421) TaxID=251221 RepID=PLSY_GLOVI|nr:glycerol-3-phosphate 1-O-acyltransferase PlsY [Gloeobacter violaceus]Q7NMV2.1 RecName: Full=Glycerol-3-phosphate acyltransferase; AltName: Full=Acyl-PO4 G3P acyltransferase; AltName: Full=Acyl-phosphate--glycerol-3-phosphate acyltransferase; AltName: Full=G3P acyltransferase; Short=GPAT; AltName: Full=Lysophosphatidic acid synthase; Short=LPA synthase [Gloeobacter violaceus PCC 7421]BAC88604.1 gll0663 [Gloeobacter violaceus PCC 7421]
MNWPLALGIWAASYLAGSLPAGYLAGRRLKNIDIREFGSGSTGATNVLRTLGRGPAAAVLLFDVFKGLFAVWLARTLAGGEDAGAWIVLGAGLAAIVGHSWPVWLAFRGGKSVAVSVGLLLGMHWPVALTVAAVWGVCFAVTRIVSFASIVAAAATPLCFYLWRAPLPFTLFGLLGGIYIVWRHRGNIERLLQGTEPKIGDPAAH